MKRYWYSLVAVLFLAFALTACGRMAKNDLPLYQRSASITNALAEERVFGLAHLKEPGPGENIKVLYLKGTPYEMGFQHGKLLKKEVQEFYNKLIPLLKFFASEDMMDEIYDRMEPYIPLEEKEEMRGLAHGADIPLRAVHWVHSVPEVSEYGPKKNFRKHFKQTICSNIAAFGKATHDGALYHMRVLDWIRQLGAQKFPVILVHKPTTGNASVTFSYAEFIGCVSGMNDKNMSFGEMGYGDPPGESLEGTPFIFLFRKLMRESNSTDDAIKIIQNTTRTCSYIYLITDAKSKDDAKKAVMLITDRSRVKVVTENTDINDERDNEAYPAIDDVVYGGAKAQILYENITKHHGRMSTESLMSMCGPISLTGNMQNVIFKPETLEAWVSNAGSSGKDEAGKACNQKWFHFDFSQYLK